MAFQPCPNTAEIRISAVLYGQRVENVLHARVSTTPDEAELNEVLSPVNDWVLGPYATNLPIALLFTDITVTDLNVSTGAQVTQSLAGETGLAAVGIKTNQDTFCIKLLTGHRGRSMRGRFYVFALTTSMYDSVDPNMITTVYEGIWVAALQSLITDLGIAEHPLGVLSRYSKDLFPTPPHLRTEGLLTDVVTAASTDRIVDSQNRRLPGRGI